MILAVNIGNTNIRAATDDGRDTVFYASEALSADNMIEQIESGLGSIWSQIQGSIVATVVPSQTDMMVTALQDKTGHPVRRIDIKNCGTLRVNRYEGLLGEDRVVCCMRALQKFSPPLIVIDFGTATTINIVNSGSEFLGGAILIGLQTGLDALNRNTAQLPPADTIPGEIPFIGKNTIENLHSGAVIGLACATEGFIRRIEEDLGKVSVIVTGGHAPVILPHCRFNYVYEPKLLLEGLLSLCGVPESSLDVLKEPKA